MTVIVNTDEERPGFEMFLVRLGVKATTCKAKAKAKDLILEDNKVGYQNEYKSATMSKFNC